MYSAAAVANTFLELAKRDGKPLSNMKLQKLVYIAHGWMLGITGNPLIKNRVEAWQWGPVIPDLYHPLKKYGSGIVDESLPARQTLEAQSAGMLISAAVWAGLIFGAMFLKMFVDFSARTHFYFTWFSLHRRVEIRAHFLPQPNTQRSVPS